jgi:bifunctional DNase/RNase
VVQVRVLGIARDAAQQHIVLLKPMSEDYGEGRVLPIWIGSEEATSILIAVSGTSAPRPLSHDLMTTLLKKLDTRLERVVVTRIEQGTFYAEIGLSGPAGAPVIDARPSDAIALAVRTGAPVFVVDEVLDEAGIPDSAVAMPSDEDDVDDEQKLNEFKRFLDDVDPEDFQG